ncbi:DTW domain-domain-containing protein, partial [Catenaria anguillulae PL171]
PHKDLVISPTAPLLECNRKRCPTCRDKCRYYCRQCLVPRGPATPPTLPPLPWTYDVFKHNQERKGKSTALHVKVLCPNESNVWTYPQDVERYTAQADPEKTLVLYPSARAQPISAIDPSSFTHIVVLDGTWYQAHQMARDTPLLQDSRVRHVSFASPPQTKFWRHQQKGGDHLATIEAMWWLVREFMVAHRPSEDYHRYDDLLWYFTFTYQRI